MSEQDSSIWHFKVYFAKESVAYVDFIRRYAVSYQGSQLARVRATGLKRTLQEEDDPRKDRRPSHGVALLTADCRRIVLSVPLASARRGIFYVSPT